MAVYQNLASTESLPPVMVPGATAGLPSVTEFQYFVTEITLLLLKFS